MSPGVEVEVKWTTSDATMHASDRKCVTERVWECCSQPQNHHRPGDLMESIVTSVKSELEALSPAATWNVICGFNFAGCITAGASEQGVLSVTCMHTMESSDEEDAPHSHSRHAHSRHHTANPQPEQKARKPLTRRLEAITFSVLVFKSFQQFSIITKLKTPETVHRSRRALPTPGTLSLNQGTRRGSGSQWRDSAIRRVEDGMTNGTEAALEESVRDTEEDGVSRRHSGASGQFSESWREDSTSEEGEGEKEGEEGRGDERYAGVSDGTGGSESDLSEQELVREHTTESEFAALAAPVSESTVAAATTPAKRSTRLSIVEDKMAEYTQLFNSIDTENNGYITAPMLGEAFGLSLEEAEEIMAGMDIIEADGQVSLDEFTQWMANNEMENEIEAGGGGSEGARVQAAFDSVQQGGRARSYDIADALELSSEERERLVDMYEYEVTLTELWQFLNQ